MLPMCIVYRGNPLIPDACTCTTIEGSVTLKQGNGLGTRLAWSTYNHNHLQLIHQHAIISINKPTRQWLNIINTLNVEDEKNLHSGWERDMLILKSPVVASMFLQTEHSQLWSAVKMIEGRRLVVLCAHNNIYCVCVLLICACRKSSENVVQSYIFPILKYSFHFNCVYMPLCVCMWVCT